MTDEGTQLLHVLDAVPQTIPHLCKRLRMTKGQLAQVVVANYAGLLARGVQLHVATASETGKAITLPSAANGNEPTYYAKLSRPGAHDDA